MRCSVIALIVALMTMNVQSLAADASMTPAMQEAIEWHKVASAIPLGSNVKVRLLDGKTIKGTLMRVDDTSLMLKKNTRRPEAATTVSFDRISNIVRDVSGGFSVGKAIAIGVGAGAGVFLTIFVIALQLD